MINRKCDSSTSLIPPGSVAGKGRVRYRTRIMRCVSMYSDVNTVK